MGVDLKNKDEIRKEMLARRRALPKEEVTAMSERIKANFFSGGFLDHQKYVFIYCSFGNEADTYGIIKECLKTGKRVAVPVVCEDMHMKAALIEDISELDTVNVFGIRQPDPENAAYIEYGDIDLAVIPGVAFDREGNRIGFGKGMYDRCIAALRPDCLKIALAFAFQILDHIPSDPHDRKVDMIIHE